MEEYTSNSHKFKEQQTEEQNLPAKKTEKVISGKAKLKKSTGLQKVVGAFLPDDMQSFGDYIFSDVVVPLVKKGITDTIDMVLYGETGHTKSSSGNSRASYAGYYKNGKQDSREDRVARPRDKYKPIIFDTRADADDVLEEMDAILEQYHTVSIMDMYDAAGISSDPTCYYTYNNYGWDDLREAQVMRGYEGYYIKLPRPIAIR